MKRNIYFFLCTFLLLVLAGCSNQNNERQEEYKNWLNESDKLKVLSTTSIINDMVKQVGGEYIAALPLIQGNLDPHSYQLVKGDDEKLKRADLIFHNGLGLEHGPSLQRYLVNHSKAVALGDVILEKNPRAIIYLNGQKDPHIWMDIALWSQTIPIIVQTLSAKDPEHAMEYHTNGQRLKERMLNIHQQIVEMMHSIPSEKRYLVSSHDAFNYFARAYLAEPGELSTGKWRYRANAPEGLAPESQLSTYEIKQIIDHIRKFNIHYLFPESNVSRDSINKILSAGREKGLIIEIVCCPLYGDVLGDPGSDGDNYIKMITYDAKLMAAHMSR